MMNDIPFACGVLAAGQKRRLVLLVLGFLWVGLGQAQVFGRAGGPPAGLASSRIRTDLEAMYETDQSLRLEVIQIEKEHGKDSPELRAAWEKQQAIDARNIVRLDEIVADVGWPGQTQFGSRAATAAFLIVQHAELSAQKRYLPYLRAAVSSGEVMASHLALLEDRVRVRDGLKQLFGSQVEQNEAGEWAPRPLECEAAVDTLRAVVGLQPLADYLQGFADQRGGSVNPQWTKPVENESVSDDDPAHG